MTISKFYFVYNQEIQSETFQSRKKFNNTFALDSQETNSLRQSAFKEERRQENNLIWQLTFNQDFILRQWAFNGVSQKYISTHNDYQLCNSSQLHRNDGNQPCNSSNKTGTTHLTQINKHYTVGGGPRL